MKFTLEEHSESGETIVLGDPFFDLTIAKVIASQRARRTGRVVVVKDSESGAEVARFERAGAPVGGSVQRMRAVDGTVGEEPISDLRRKTSA